jgi:hypothetical protein
MWKGWVIFHMAAYLQSGGKNSDFQRMEGAMTNVQAASEDWMEKNGPMLIQCPHQPGKLRITRDSCSKRREKARVQDYGRMLEGSFIDYSHKVGLFVCLYCRGEE